MHPLSAEHGPDLQLVRANSGNWIFRLQSPLVDSPIPTAAKVAVGPLIILIPFHLSRIAEELWRHKKKTSREPTAGLPGWLRHTAHFVTTGASTGLILATWKLRASTLSPVGVQVAVSSVLSWPLAACMCAYLVYPYNTWRPQLSWTRLFHHHKIDNFPILIVPVVRLHPIQ